MGMLLWLAHTIGTDVSRRSSIDDATSLLEVNTPPLVGDAHASQYEVSHAAVAILEKCIRRGQDGTARRIGRLARSQPCRMELVFGVLV